MFHVPGFIDGPFPTWLAPILLKNRSLRFNQSEVPWISLGDRFVKLCSTKRDLRLNSKLQNNSFYGPCPAFLGFNGPSMIRSFPLLQESSELRFRFFLHNFGTKCLSKVNPRHWIYISFPVIYSRFKRALVFFWPPDIVNFRIKSLFAITLVQSRRNVHTFDCRYFPLFNFQMSCGQLPVTPLLIFGAKRKWKPFKRDKSTSRDFVARSAASRPKQGPLRGLTHSCGKSKDYIRQSGPQPELDIKFPAISFANRLNQNIGLTA